MSIRKDDVYDRVMGLAWQVIDESVLILEPKTKKAHELNHVASFVWTELDGSKSVQEMVQLIGMKYDIDSALIEEEVIDFYTSLRDQGLIECL